MPPAFHGDPDCAVDRRVVEDVRLGTTWFEIANSPAQVGLLRYAAGAQKRQEQQWCGWRRGGDAAGTDGLQA